MAVEQYVALNRSMLPTVTQWAQAVSELGFAVEIDEVDLVSHTGFLPVRFLETGSGFEYYLEEVDDEIRQHHPVTDQDSIVVFRTGSDVFEAQTALVCAAGLIHATGGIYFDAYGGFDDDASHLASQASQWLKGELN